MISCVSAHAALAQLVERLTRNEKVTSPILVSGSPSHFHGLPPGSRAMYLIGRWRKAVHARVAELVDAQDLGSCVFDVRVQVPSRAHSSGDTSRLKDSLFITMIR